MVRLKTNLQLFLSLKGNNEVVQGVELKAEDNWKGTFTNISGRDSYGNLMDYTVETSTIKDYKIEVVSVPVIGDIRTSG